MTRDQAIRKVRACLRLAASSNPNEAAAAMRQAQALMHKYGLTPDDADAAEVLEADATTRSRGGDLSRSVLGLASIVASWFRSRCLVVKGLKATTVRFMGLGSDPEIAAYAFAVLRRQMERDTRKHTARIRKRANKIARGEAFAIGWQAALFERMQSKESPHSARIEAAMRSRYTGFGNAAAKPVPGNGKMTENDLHKGYEAGKRAQLNPGVGGTCGGQLQLAADRT